jgi:hypothetical protein
MISDGVLESNVFLNEAKSRGAIKYKETGTKYDFPQRHAANTIVGYGPMMNKTISQPVLHRRGELEWGGFYGDYFIDNYDVLANSNASEAIFNMQEEYLDNLRDDFHEVLEDYCFTDGLTETPRKWGGLEAFTNTSGNYANISQSNADWKAQLLAGAQTSTVGGSFKVTTTEYATRILTRLLNLCVHGKQKGGKNRPGALFTDRANWNHVHDRIEANRRVISDASKIKAGFQNWVWSGVPGYWSDSCPAEKVYAVNFNYLKFCMQTAKLAVSNSSKWAMPIGTLHQLYNKGQMVCTNPRMMGLISATGVT